MCRHKAVKAFEELNDETSTSSGNNANSKLPGQALQMLEMVRSATRNVPSVAGLFMDELASIFEYDDLHMDLITWISDKMVYSFESDFVTLLSEEADGNEDDIIPLKLDFKLNHSDAHIGQVSH